MKYLLDTNICIYAINGRHQHLTRQLLSISPDDIAISSITLGELEYGAAKSNWSTRTREIFHAFLANFTVIDFTEDDALLFGRNRAILEKAGNVIGLLDLMIGSQGIRNKLTVVTHNTREFERIPGITLEDWTDAH